MLDWLRRDWRAAPEIELAGRRLPIVIRRLARARRMTLRLGPGGEEVRISIPEWGRTEDALAFARSRADWLAGQLAAMPESEAPAPGGSLAYRGAALTIVHRPLEARRVALSGSSLVLGGPQETVAPRLRRWLAGEAKVLCAQDLEHYCARIGRAPPPLALSSARRRWGSCATNGTIRINWRLVMAPDHVRRSVVAHEVAHLVHFDHSPRFHALLDEIFEGDIGGANRWLKANGRGLYAPFG